MVEQHDTVGPCDKSGSASEVGQGACRLSDNSLALPSPLCGVATEVGLVQFHEPGIFNYSALLMSDDKGTLYVGAREAVFAVNALDISEKQHEVGPVASQPCSCRRGCLRYLPISSLHRPGSRLPQDAQLGCSHVSSVLSSTLSGHL